MWQLAFRLSWDTAKSGVFSLGIFLSEKQERNFILKSASWLCAVSVCRFFSPLGMAPVVGLVGLGLFERGFPAVGIAQTKVLVIISHWYGQKMELDNLGEFHSLVICFNSHWGCFFEFNVHVHVLGSPFILSFKTLASIYQHDRLSDKILHLMGIMRIKNAFMI